MSVPVKTILVTGASRGIGLELVRQIASSTPAPEVVIAACRDPASAAGLQDLARNNPKVKVIKMDVGKDDDIESAVKETQTLVGDKGLNFIINNAGLNVKTEPNSGIYHCTRDGLQKHFDVNVSSPLMVTQKFLPLIKAAVSQKPTKEVNCQAGVAMISSIMASQTIAALEGKGTSLQYKCSKSAVTMASILLSRELAPEGIYCTAIHPGWVKTDMGGSAADLTVEESARSVLKIIADASAASSGKLMNYDGGVLPY